jgi:hypothetical protein
MALDFLLAPSSSDSISFSSAERERQAQGIASVALPGSPVSQNGLMEGFLRPALIDSSVLSASSEYVAGAGTRGQISPTLDNTLFRQDIQFQIPYETTACLRYWPHSLTSNQNLSHQDISPASVRSSTQKVFAEDLTPRIPRAGGTAGHDAACKTHVCFCERAFTKREHLKRHILLVHQEVRPFTCKDCDLHFGTKQNHQVHLGTRKHRQRVVFERTGVAKRISCPRKDGGIFKTSIFAAVTRQLRDA